MSKEHRDYILMKEIYHCTPSEIEEQDENMLNLHYNFLMEERQHEYIESKRAEQKAKQKQSSFPKKR